ncbi:hypothetical protein ABVT39_005785 [Epinephelus coioides]
MEMAEGLRSKLTQDSVNDTANFNKELANMIDSTLQKQHVFIEEQFAKFETRLDKIHKEVSANSKAITRLQTDHKVLTSRVTRAEESIQVKCSSMEARLARYEDR